MNMMWFMPSCKEVTDRLAEGELENAPWHKRLLISMHLAMCVHCGRFAKQLALIARALHEQWRPQASSELLEAVKRRILAGLK